MHRSPAPRRRRRGLAAALALTAGLIGSTVHATPASALGVPGDALVFAPTSALTNLVWRVGKTYTFAVGGPYSQSLVGNFDGTLGGDLLIYRPGPGEDAIQHIEDTGSTTSSSLTPIVVSGSFQPFVGDFDGNGIDDVFWYAPGAARDYIWLFDAAGAHTTVSKSVGGTYRPLVLDTNGDGRDDIVWYAPGAASDAMWLFGAGASHTTKAVTIGGSYTTSVGTFGLEGASDPDEGIVFYNPSGPDYLWTFTPTANHLSHSLPNVDGNYQLLPGQYLEETYGSLLYYGPGSLPEHLFAFGPGPGADVSEQEAPNIGGTYVVRAGDFNSDGLTDLSLTTNPTTRIWYFDGGQPASSTSFANAPNVLGGPTVVPTGT